MSCLAVSVIDKCSITFVSRFHCYGYAKMAEEEMPHNIEEALNEIVKTMDKSGNMKKELKKTIYENVSTLRNLFVKMKEKLEEGTRLKDQMDNENKALKTELDACRKVINNASTYNKRETSSDRERVLPRTISGQVLPFNGCRSANNTSTKNKRETSRDRVRVPPKTASRQLLPSLGSTLKLYSDVVAGHDEKKFKLALRTKGTHTPDEIKNLLKEKMNLTEIKVGIQSLKHLRDG